MKLRVERAMLVYQAGIANVFKVDCFNLSPFGREAKRLYQGTFDGAKWLCIGLQSAGTTIKVAACNKAGDIKDMTWTDKLYEQPFCDKFDVSSAWTK